MAYLRRQNCQHKNIVFKSADMQKSDLDRIATVLVVWFNLLASMAASHISMIFLSCLIVPRICYKKSDCCYEKQVGNVTYTLVDKSNTTVAYNCLDGCIYEEKNVAGSRVCFRTGHLPVTCLKETGSYLQIIDQLLFCTISRT
jgi:hypothetical protein